MSRQVIVAGFHRSGTSLACQLLDRAGLFFGGDMLGPDYSNPRGHFEDREVLDLHKEILASNEVTWQLDEPFSPILDDDHLRRMRELVASRNAEHEQWAFKDPRVCWFLPSWMELLPNASVLLVYRHFTESTHSLGKRHSTALFTNPVDADLHRRFWEEPDLALRMWLAHNEALLAFARSHRDDVLAVSHGMLLGGFPLIEAISRRFGLDLADLPVSDVFDSSVSDAWRGSQPVADESLIEPVREVWQALEELGEEAARTAGVAPRRWPSSEDDFHLDTDIDAMRMENDLRGFRVRFLEDRLRESDRSLEHRKEEAERLTHELQVRYAELQSEREATADFKRFVADATRHLTAGRGLPTLARALTEAVTRVGPRVQQLRVQRWKVARAVADLRGGAPWGQATRRFQSSFAPNATPAWQGGSPEYVLDSLDRSPATILLPVHNAYEELVACLRSVVRHTSSPAELLLIDDASTDPRIASLLAEYAARPHVRVLRNEHNLGFVRTVNRGLSDSDGDVILLNSDTEVPPRWLESLTLAAHSNPRTATVTPVSNNAGAFSVPELEKDNPLPAEVPPADVARLVTQSSAQIYPQAPTGSGYTMYIKRAALDDVGLFDAEHFPRGYGEENDFCMRARRRGWTHVVDDATFIFHKRSSSFGAEKAELLARGRETLDRLHPEYTGLAHAFVTAPDLRRVGANVGAAYGMTRSRRDRIRPRALFVLHEGQGGTPHTTADLMEALSGRYAAYLLVADGLHLKLFRRSSGRRVLVEAWRLRDRTQATEFTRPDYREIVFSLLVKYRFELVHIRHLLWHTFDLPEIAARLGIPVVLSFHDFYFSCPTVHLLDDNGNHCGGVCTPGYGQCTIPFRTLRRELPILKHAWLGTWRREVERMFAHIDAFVTTSEAARDVYLRSLPVLGDRRFEVIDHGRDLVQARCAVAPGEGKIRILLPGNINVQKGGQLIRAIQRIDAGRKLEFHLLGAVAPDCQDLGTNHGRFKREQFNERVAEIAPSFIGIFSIWPETYCHTLTEAWGAGVPVLASNIGTLRERVNAHGGGWLIDQTDPGRAYEQILDVAADRDGYLRELERATLAGIRTTAEMADDYDRLYGAVLRERLRFDGPYELREPRDSPFSPSQAR